MKTAVAMTAIPNIRVVLSGGGGARPGYAKVIHCGGAYQLPQQNEETALSTPKRSAS